MQNALVHAIEANLLDAYERLGRALEADFHRDARYTAFFSASKLALCNGVSRFHCAPEEADTILAIIEREARARQAAVTCLVGPSTRPNDLEQRLTQRGWSLDEEVPGMAIDLARWRAPASTVSVREVTENSMLASWLSVLCTGFGFPEALQQVFNGLYRRYGFSPDRSLRFFLGFKNNEPVATTLLVEGGGTVGLYGIATVPHARRLGIGTAITRAAMQEARQAGHRYATLQATPMGFPLYRRLGWHTCTHFKTFIYRPASTDTRARNARPETNE
ncbi:acetyltransferase (GNAT) family protein [Thermosporothrix hazakensis]|jgi:GNAT superfamily N-acetyltransferase|uniref:Acetyltransferase (GNAT) family protein n=1 Tax=Thermosporothrix hazakensis TaxID=644383 RepID=A0A326U742_THEHA|nr:GNAT family N-acetyltransferase [Thermosporothrix hazakensis]PZW29352.1 acetyltransferase (GNAT) family protein [Thermosporothrix hazakensis]GCE45298.1 hypothetical protein KTH_01670 [Thermosporothrix hazakensis]